MGAGERCRFCSREAALRPSPTIALCEECAIRVAEVAAESSGRIWADHDQSPRAVAEAASISTRIAEERALDALKRGVTDRISDVDAETHYNLAHAYTEMGLYLDARRTVAIAIAARKSNALSEAALLLLLSKPLLRRDGLERLGERLKRTLH